MGTSPPPAGSGWLAHLRLGSWPARTRIGLLVALMLLSAGAWALTIQQTNTMDMPMGVAVPVDAGTNMSDMGDMPDMGDMAGMTGMEAPAIATAGWSIEAATAFLVIWAVMMAAMMLPAAAPMVLVFDSIQAKRRGQPSFVPTWIFVAGYLLVWTAVGLGVYVLVQLGSDLALRMRIEDRETWAPLVLGGTLVAAGLYQLTPLKRVCLDHCRSPLGFVLGHWREGRLGALRMGLHHGGYCLGCCWLLFAVLVAAGVMSLAWMVLLTLIVFVEKVFSQGRRFSVGVGAALVALGLLVGGSIVSMPWTV